MAPVKILGLEIDHLFGTKSYNLQFVDNTIILVGENGSGKSTILNIFYCIVSLQWAKLKAFDFSSLRLSYIPPGSDHTEILTLTRKEISEGTGKSRQFAFARAVERRLEQFPPSMRMDPDIHRVLAEEMGVPPSLVRESAIETLETFGRGDFQRSKTDTALDLKRTKVEKDLGLSANRNGLQILYLPTYRRIERELEEIGHFSHFSTSRRDEQRSRRHRPSSRMAPPPHYLELVEFGMEDVSILLTEKLRKLDMNWRAQLNQLTAANFRDILDGAYRTTTIEAVDMPDDDVLDEIFQRVSDRVLTSDDKGLLRRVLNKYRQKANDITEADRIIAHFTKRLVDLHRTQTGEEHEIEALVEVINGYLVSKRFNFDRLQFHMRIDTKGSRSKKRQVSGGFPARSDIDSDPLLSQSLKELSSGEKQIVSLFSHMFLSGAQNYFVLIDEPELSLSVEWQQRFLVSIKETGRCAGLFAVTHSPYVADNELDPYLHGVNEFVVPKKKTKAGQSK